MQTSWEFHRELTDRALRARLERYARRRLDEADAEDAVQQALCEAVASARLAQIPERAGIGAWVMTILKRRICDVFRARRATTTECDATTHPEGQFAARDLLRRVASEASGANEQTLGWLLREYSGETIARIAQQDRLPAPLVRQRIHRFRRRARVLYFAVPVMALLVALGALMAPKTTARIEADQASMPALDVSAVRGHYRVERLTVAEDVAASDKLLVGWAAHGHVTVTPDSIVIDDGVKARTVHIVRMIGDRVIVRSDDGSEHTLRATRAGDAIVVDSLEGRFRGRVYLTGKDK